MKEVWAETEIGVITAIKGDEAWVEIISPLSCQECAARIVCIPDQSGKRQLKAYNRIGARVGQKVTVSEKPNFLFYISLIQYGLPLLGFLAGVISSYIMNLSCTYIPAELCMFLAGLSGLGLAAMLGRSLMKRMARQGCAFSIDSLGPDNIPRSE
jgi:positive regulator of sigma E activity